MKFQNFGAIAYNRWSSEQFKSGGLPRGWAKKYPFLFDHEDYRRAEKQAYPGYRFILKRSLWKTEKYFDNNLDCSALPVNNINLHHQRFWNQMTFPRRL